MRILRSCMAGWILIACTICVRLASSQELGRALAKPDAPNKALDSLLVPEPPGLAALVDQSTQQPPEPQRPTDPSDKIARANLPKTADAWDFIGTYKLRDGGTDRTVTLYYLDSDSLAKRGGIGFYPNFFSIYAVFRDDAGKWVHKEVYSAARVGFVRIKKHTPEAVVVELSPRFMVFIEPGVPFKKELKRAEEINKPFEMRLAFDKGVPVLRP